VVSSRRKLTGIFLLQIAPTDLSFEERLAGYDLYRRAV
jgi:hypothetical protein